LSVPDNVDLDELDFRNENFDLQRVQDWVEKYDGMNGRFHFFQAYMPLSPLYQCVGKPLLSMKASGSMYIERAAKPFKHLILRKDRNSLSDAKGVKLFRSQQNLKHLQAARQVLKSKVYDGVVSRDPLEVLTAFRNQSRVCDLLHN
jgi:hypothetical protein